MAGHANRERRTGPPVDVPPVLPTVLPIVDSAVHESRGLRPLLAVEELIEAGAPLIWWRDPERRVPLEELAAHLPLSRIVLSARSTTAALGLHAAAGQHWGGPAWRDASVLPGRSADDAHSPRLCGASAHSLADLAIAARLGCHYATLSPIFPSDSKPGYGPALGLSTLRDAATQYPALAVLALGGVSLPRLAELHGAGAHGVAALGAFACARPGDVWRAWRDAWGE
ncbi:MAG: thiamine-phosphate pyrophosphorylase [Flavobacteriales bacterium]|jgi:thiamine-phosphate pyrophosphorylase